MYLCCLTYKTRSYTVRFKSIPAMTASHIRPVPKCGVIRYKKLFLKRKNYTGKNYLSLCYISSEDVTNISTFFASWMVNKSASNTTTNMYSRSSTVHVIREKLNSTRPNELEFSNENFCPLFD